MARVLAGAVFALEGVDGAGGDVDGYALVGLHAGEFFGEGVDGKLGACGVGGGEADGCGGSGR